MKLARLNFPEYQFKFKYKENKYFIFSEIRKKYLQLTPEEWVRQHCVQFLLHEKDYNRITLNEEKSFKINDVEKRYDIVSYAKDASVDLVVECKAPDIQIKQTTFDQIARYNLVLKADYLMLTNGLDHYFCQMNYEKQSYNFLPDLPKKTK
jgi:hypothetical protein